MCAQKGCLEETRNLKSKSAKLKTNCILNSYSGVMLRQQIVLQIVQQKWERSEIKEEKKRTKNNNNLNKCVSIKLRYHSIFISSNLLSGFIF